MYQRLRSAVLSGQLRPGEKLVERQLAEQFGVSRTPLRAAVERLASHGLVVRGRERGRGGYGYEVASATVSEVTEAMTIRIALESVATRLAAERATAEEVAELQQLLERLIRAQAGRGAQAIDRTHLAFHEAIYRFARSPRLHDLLAGLQDYIRIVISQSYKDTRRLERSLAEHRDLVWAISRHDGPLAEYLSRRHIENSHAAYLQALETASESEAQL
ncbi:MAG: GntR family transcriptional regulator [Symbiobacteriia bacterium]